MKEQFFANFERALNEYEAKGLHPSAAHFRALFDAMRETYGAVNEADFNRLREKEHKH